MSHRAVEHQFRRKYGSLVATLLRQFGHQYLDQIEDAVQFAMVQALDHWRRKEPPDNATGWLFRVAQRKLLSDIRCVEHHRGILQTLKEEVDVNEGYRDPTVPLSQEMSDALLRALFMACNPLLPLESQLVLTLKSLCGFSVTEIAGLLLISPTNVYKRFTRAKNKLATMMESPFKFDTKALGERLNPVLKVLYLMFTEGHMSASDQGDLKRDLCLEAIHLTKLLSQCPPTNAPATQALLALMYLHWARMNARVPLPHSVYLLEQQDRQQWNQAAIAAGLTHLTNAINPALICRYHIEASIAAEHCLAPTFAQTRWQKIVADYTLLGRLYPSPMVWLAKAVAQAESETPQHALATLTRDLAANPLPPALPMSYPWYAVQADLWLRCGDRDKGLTLAQQALSMAPNSAVKSSLTNRFRLYGIPIGQ